MACFFIIIAYVYCCMLLSRARNKLTINHIQQPPIDIETNEYHYFYHKHFEMSMTDKASEFCNSRKLL